MTNNRFSTGFAALIAAGLLASGCGGGDDDNNDAAKPAAAPNAAQAKGDDAQAKSDARNLEVELEVCYTDSQSYASCPKTTVGVATAAGTDTGYKITSKSRSGNSFVIEKGANGAVTRSCTTEGEGGCPTGGEW